MPRRVWVTRARPGADRTAERLTALGYIPLVVPLLEVRPLDVRLDLDGVEALAFTSLNGVAAFAALTPDRTLPVFAVGDATARAAQTAGFAAVRSAAGDLTALAALIRGEAPGCSILHPAAVEPAGDLAATVGPAARVRVVSVYETRDTGAAPPALWDAVLLHSPRAARAMPRHLAGGIAVALSPAVAAALSDQAFAALHIADAPTETALLTALGKPGPAV
ncbi:uroporphyrinogen-III synthase [Brevundimonas sp. LM2]|uniref:uroporphyrinogen-III synthase n=1 Tax=Brevundimonas sp. LM2 TaxID=1938605 RepID=UPI00209B9087|nr:uroporphyrinogen-III synthase [Brevundimonas sp. LM2]